MKETRLEHLYRRPLAFAGEHARTFPLEHVLAKELVYYPQKPAHWDFDILEIGPGWGDFFIHLAQSNPRKKILGIEVNASRCREIMHKAQRAGVSNVTLINGDARAALRTDLNAAKFEKIFVLFPDPWPRNRHSHLRLLSKEFLTLVCGKLNNGGEFTLATDVSDYARWATKNFETVPGLASVYDSNDAQTPPPDLVTTEFERKWRERGRMCHYVRYARVLQK